MFNIKIEIPNDSELIIEYPEDKINDIKSCKKSYKIENNAILINNGMSRNIICPQYTHRIIILFDIMIGVWIRKYHKINFCYDGKESKNLKGLIRKKIKLDNEFLDQEKRLLKSVLESLVKETTINIENDIKYGYDLVIELLACGGIK